MKEPGLCSCGQPGVYDISVKARQGSYWRCRQCHRDKMRLVMRKRYATPEGRAANQAATKKWYDKNRKVNV